MGDFVVWLRTAEVLPHFPKPLTIGEETQTSAAYHWEGKARTCSVHGVFQYTLSGAGVFRNHDGKHIISAGNGFLSESHDPHTACYYPAAASEPWRFVFIAFMGQAAFTMLRDLVRQYGPIYQLPANHFVIKRLRAFQVYDHTNQMLMASEGAQLVMDVLNALAATKEARRLAHPDHLLIRQAMDEIQCRINERLHVGDVAKTLRISREHLTRVFNQNIAISPHAYIVSSKMLVACRLLRDQSLSIKEIAFRLGYNNPGQFIQIFRRELRMTPGKFRRENAFFIDRWHKANICLRRTSPSLPAKKLLWF